MNILEITLSKGNQDLVELLLSRIPRQLVFKDSWLLALKHAHVKLATEIFMLSNVATSFNLKHHPKLNLFDVLNHQEVEDIARSIANNSKTELLPDLGYYAGRYNFHFQLLVDHVLPLSPSPTFVLKKVLPNLLSQLQFAEHNVIVLNLIALSSFVNSLLETRSLIIQERHDATDIVKLLDLLIHRAMSAESFDDSMENVHSLIVPDRQVRYRNPLIEVAFAFRHGPLSSCLKHNISSIFNSSKATLMVEQVFWSVLPRGSGTTGQFFGDDSVCIHSSDPKVPPTNLQQYFMHFQLLMKLFIGHFPELEKHALNILELKSPLLFGRYSPAIMFFGECVSKSIFVLLLSLLSMHTYSPSIPEVRSYTPDLGQLRVALYVFQVSLMLYEYGQLCEKTTTILPGIKSIRAYFSDVWNLFDFTSLLLVFLWLNFKIDPQHVSFRALLSPSIFLMTLSLLRHFIVFPRFGDQTLLLVAMTGDLSEFFFVYVFFTVGFTLTMWSLFSDIDGYQTFAGTFFTLVSISMGNVDFTQTANSPYHGVGTAVTFIYLLLSSVVLINMIIAQMSSTHGDMTEKIEKERFFQQACITRSYLLLEERNPFCMLPAPLNLFPASLMLVHKFIIDFVLVVQDRIPPTLNPLLAYLLTVSQIRLIASRIFNMSSSFSKGKCVSIPGTLSDFVLGILLSFFLPFFEFGSAISKFTQILLHQFPTEGNYWLQLVIMILFFLVVYPVYVVRLLLTILCNYSKIKVVVENVGGKMATRYYIRYAEQTRQSLDQGEKAFKVRLFSGSDLDVLTHPIFLYYSNFPSDQRHLPFPFIASAPSSSQPSAQPPSIMSSLLSVSPKPIHLPTVVLRVGETEFVFPEPQKGGPNPLWGADATAYIPVHLLEECLLKHPFIELDVFDKEVGTSRERKLILTLKQAVNIHQLLENNGEEKTIQLGTSFENKIPIISLSLTKCEYSTEFEEFEERKVYFTPSELSSIFSSSSMIQKPEDPTLPSSPSPNGKLNKIRYFRDLTGRLRDLNHSSAALIQNTWRLWRDDFRPASFPFLLFPRDAILEISPPSNLDSFKYLTSSSPSIRVVVQAKRSIPPLLRPGFSDPIHRAASNLSHTHKTWQENSFFQVHSELFPLLSESGLSRPSRWNDLYLLPSLRINDLLVISVLEGETVLGEVELDLSRFSSLFRGHSIYLKDLLLGRSTHIVEIEKLKLPSVIGGESGELGSISIRLSLSPLHKSFSSQKLLVSSRPASPSLASTPTQKQIIFIDQSLLIFPDSFSIRPYSPVFASSTTYFPCSYPIITLPDAPTDLNLSSDGPLVLKDGAGRETIIEASNPDSLEDLKVLKRRSAQMRNQEHLRAIVQQSRSGLQPSRASTIRVEDEGTTTLQTFTIVQPSNRRKGKAGKGQAKGKASPNVSSELDQTNSRPSTPSPPPPASLAPSKD